MFYLDTTDFFSSEGIFVLVGIAVLVTLYILLNVIKFKKNTAIEPKDAVSADAPSQEEEEKESFRPVVFIRTNDRRINAEISEKEDKHDSENTNV